MKIKDIPKRATSFFLALIIAVSGIFWWPRHASATTDTFTTSGTWTAPANVYSATFEAWGGGGAGGGATASGASGGGGAGGQYAKKTYSVNPGYNYTVTVSTITSGTTGNGANGGDSQVSDPSSTTVVLAKGGTGGGADNGAGGLGSTTGGIGDLVYKGGSGTGGGAGQGGGGGGGAGSTGNGGGSSNNLGGTGTSSNGGDGGTGPTSRAAGGSGSNYGGAGAGGYHPNGPSQNGGDGAPGLVTVTYTPVSLTQSNYQWFTNTDSVTPGSALTGSQSQSATLSSTGQTFRLRQLVNPSNSVSAGTLNYDEQYAYLSNYGSCSAIPSTDWANVGSNPVTPTNSTFSGTTADGGGPITWSNTSLITAQDGSYSTVNLPDGTISNVLKATNFGFSIPSAATINGVAVTVRGKSSNIYEQDTTARLVKAGVVQSTDRGLTNWTNGFDTDMIHGSSNDLWGGSYTPTDINDSGFGFAISVTNNGPPVLNDTVSVDSITIKVYYTVGVTTIGPRFPATGSTDSGSGNFTWNNPSNITAQDAVYAASTMSTGGVTDNLNASNYGFSLPNSAVINGIVVDISGLRSGLTTLTDSSVKLLKAGTAGGNNNSAGASWGTSSATHSFGSSADLWGQTWTPSDINNSGFGVQYIASRGGTTGITDLDIDSIQITIYYSLPAIAYKDNSTPANGAAISATGSDPTDSTNTVSPQTYQEANGFTTTSTTGGTVDAEWDLSMVDNNAPASTTYCFRTVVGGGTAFGTYNFYPQITTASSNSPPGAPTLSSPASGATNVDVNPDFTLSSTDTDSDHLKYKIVLYDSDCSSAPPPYGTVQTFDQTSDQTNWTGQDQDGGTTYASGSPATYSLAGTPLSFNHTYCWKGAAMDPLGSATFSSYSATQTFTTEALVNHPVNINGNVNIFGGTNIY